MKKRNIAWAQWIVGGLAVLGLLGLAYCSRPLHGTTPFRHPIAFAVANDSLWVLEKKNNTLLRLTYQSVGAPLTLLDRRAIEPDDALYYYMVRKLFPGPKGLVVQSYIYTRTQGEFQGYRFREYNANAQPIRDLLTVFLENPKDYPEMKYACGPAGDHYFINDCPGCSNLWKVTPSGGLVVRGHALPPGIQTLGDINTPLAHWPSVTVASNGHIYACSGAQDCVVEYNEAGHRIRTIGVSGFDPAQLVAPHRVMIVALATNEPARLTVASAGTRSWLQYDEAGRAVRTLQPLQAGYPFKDIPVSEIYEHTASGARLAFDLANRVLIVVSDRFAVIAQYQTQTHPALELLLVAVLILLGLALAPRLARRLLARLRLPFVVKLLTLFIPLLALSALVVGDWVGDMMMKELEQESVRRSANLAQAVLNSVNLADLESIQMPQDRESPVYERIYRSINRIVDGAQVAYTPKWILHKIRDGRYYYGINIWRGPIFEPFVVPQDRPMFQAVLKDKRNVHGRFTDDQGQWFSYLAPILNAQSEVIYVLELYRPTEALDRADDQVYTKVLNIVAVTLLIAIVIGLVFSHIFTRPLRDLMKATELVSRGDFTHTIHVRSRDELSKLAAAFNQMIVNLKHYTEELARATAARERIESELKLARDVQQSIIPKTFPPFPDAEHIDIFAVMEPAREEGGDFYDFFLIDDHHMGLVVADVSGKGVSAGLFMMMARTLLRGDAISDRNLSPADTLTRLNRHVCADNPSCFFVTVYYLVCDMRTGRVTYCNAGHNTPFVLRRAGVESMKIREGDGHGPAIGLMDTMEYSESTLTLAPGDTLLIYTDGLTEPVNRQGVMYGELRLEQFLATHPGPSNKTMCQALVADVQTHQSGLDQFDDITVVAFRYLE